MATARHSLRTHPPVAVEVFAGIGGLSLGLERAGFDVAAAIELDPNHASVHEFNFPRTVVIQADAATVSARRVRKALRRGLRSHERDDKKWVGQIDLLAGGPPCQGFSDGGTHDPNDRRNQLIFEFARFVRDLEPRFFFMENVPGLLRGKHKHTWNRLVAELVKSGYEVADPAILRSCDFGVPQDRDRLFLFGWQKGEQPVAPPAPEEERVTTVREALSGLPNASRFPELLATDVLRLKRLDKRARDRLAEPSSAYAKQLRDDNPKCGFRRKWCGRAMAGMGLTQHSREVVKRFMKTPAGGREVISRYARLDPNGLCPTLRSGTGPDHGSHTPPRPIHPSGERVITVREAARLHSFPDWFAFHATKWHAWRGIGNAVPPLLALAVAREFAQRCNVLDTVRETLPWGDPTTIGYDEVW